MSIAQTILYAQWSRLLEKTTESGATIDVAPDYKNIPMFIENLKMKLGVDNQYDIQCGYEAGCLGYSLYNQLTAANVKCVILEPTTLLTP